MTKIELWLALAMLVMVTLAVGTLGLRAFAGLGWIGLQEAVLWLHAALFIAGGWLAIKHNEHVRIEIIRDRQTPFWRHKLESVGHILLLLPMMVVIIWSSAPAVLRSWEQGERSAAAGGLPGLFILKTILPLTALCIIVWSVRQLRQSWQKP